MFNHGITLVRSEGSFPTVKGLTCYFNTLRREDLPRGAMLYNLRILPFVLFYCIIDQVKRMVLITRKMLVLNYRSRLAVSYKL